MKNYLKNEFDNERLCEILDELPLWSAPFGLRLLEFVEYKPDIAAVDIGSGTGFPLTELAMRLGEGSVVYGIDPRKEALARANKKIEFCGIQNVRTIEGVAESIPLDDDSIDLITSNNGINNVKDMNRALSECSRIIKTGGQFVMTMNTDLTMFEFYRHLEGVLSELNMKEEIERMHRHISQKRPSVDTMISRIQSHGFFIKDLVHDQSRYKFTDGTAMLNHFFIRLAFMDPWIRLLPPGMVEPVFDRIENRFNEQSKRYGGIQLSIPFVLINSIKK